MDDDAPYEPVLTAEERAAVRREWLAGLERAEDEAAHAGWLLAELEEEGGTADELAAARAGLERAEARLERARARVREPGG